MRSSFWQQLVSFPAMLVSILFVSPFFASLDVQQGGPVMRDPDLWWHLRNAQVLLLHITFIRPGYLFLHHSRSAMDQSEWLAEIPYYWRFSVFAERGVFLVMIFAIDLIIAGVLLLLLSNAQAKIPHHGWLHGLRFCLQAINIGPRTILFGWLCFLAEMLILEVFRRGRDRLWLLVPLFALWIIFTVPGSLAMASSCSTSHRAWWRARGAASKSVQWTPQQWRKLITVGTVSLAAFSLTHMAGGLWSIRLISSSVSNSTWLVVDEWHSVDFQSYYGTVVFFDCYWNYVVTLAQRRSWLLSMCSLPCSPSMRTHAQALSVPRWHHRLPHAVNRISQPRLLAYDPRKDKRWLNVTIMSAFYLFGIYHIPSSASLHAAESQFFPADALRDLNSHCANQRVLNRYEWGGYLIWNARAIPVSSIVELISLSTTACFSTI